MFHRPQFLSIAGLMIVVILISMRLQRKGIKSEIEAAQL
jgi:hypothetical protein